MINRVVLVGRITKAPVLRKTQQGISVVSFTLACNRRVATQGQDADFINCVAWNKLADLMVQYVSKGALIGIEGRIQTRSYDDKDGKHIYVTEVITESLQFLESKKDKSDQTSDDSKETGKDANGFDHVDTLDIASDDLPF